MATAVQLEAIERHGQQLLAIFPKATVRDPISLCRGLRRLEAKATKITLRLCNGPEFEGGYEEVDRKLDYVLGEVDRLLKYTEAGPKIFVNRDPRGYALKIDEQLMRGLNKPLHRDWGGYGIIAPEIGKNGE